MHVFRSGASWPCGSAQLELFMRLSVGTFRGARGKELERGASAAHVCTGQFLGWGCRPGGHVSTATEERRGREV